MDSQAGAPPDAFSAAGQNWGFPTYDWERMSRDDYAWWRARLRKMSEYFDAYRIDHILGFFRIWEIPVDAVHGLLGHFNPAMPYPAEELRGMGFDLAEGRYTTPPTDGWILERLFGELAGEVRTKYLRNGHLLPVCATQRRVQQLFPGDDERSKRLRDGFLALLDDVLFVEDPYRKGHYHPRIAAQSTFSFQLLSPQQQEAFNRLHDDFFYRRHDRFWQESALRKLPMLLRATDMLACGEDLGMIPDCVPETMRALKILSLEIQRMPKSLSETFADPAHYPYLSVCTTSTHDMNPLRAWWEEDRSVTDRFYHEVLHGVSVFAKPGQKVAFVGATGAGKTTITNLINRFYDIADGKIRYDGINVNKIRKADLRRSLGVVLQDVNLFTGTVMDNIRYGNLDATDEECIAAAKLAGADDFITRLPDGYDTMLTGNGAQLSQGQRQLISIARAAVADPPAMILDEATSSIDTRTEAIVQAGMDKLMEGRTTFVIAHRLSTVRNSDAIICLDHGRIIERGNHDELIAKRGYYYQLYTGAFELE